MSKINNKNLNLVIDSLLDMTGKNLSLWKVHDIWMERVKLELSEDSYLYYQCHLPKIVKFFVERNILTVEDIDESSFQMFIRAERAKGNKNKTINKAVDSLSYAINHCIKKGYLYENPVKLYNKLHEEDVEIKVLPKNVIKNVTKYFEKPFLTEEELLQRAAVFLVLDTGIRRNELRHVELKNIDLKRGSVRLVRTKTRDHRTQYIQPITAHAITEYIEAFKPGKYLFEVDGQITHRKYVAWRIKKLIRLLNLPEDTRFSLHVFRHSFATYSLVNGANIKYVQDAMGHKNLTTTMRYLHLTETLMKETHSKTSIFSNM